MCVYINKLIYLSVRRSVKVNGTSCHCYLLQLIKNVDQIFTNLLHRRKLEAENNKKKQFAIWLRRNNS